MLRESDRYNVMIVVAPHELPRSAEDGLGFRGCAGGENLYLRTIHASPFAARMRFNQDECLTGTQAPAGGSVLFINEDTYRQLRGHGAVSVRFAHDDHDGIVVLHMCMGDFPSHDAT